MTYFKFGLTFHLKSHSFENDQGQEQVSYSHFHGWKNCPSAYILLGLFTELVGLEICYLRPELKTPPVTPLSELELIDLTIGLKAWNKVLFLLWKHRRGSLQWLSTLWLFRDSIVHAHRRPKWW